VYRKIERKKERKIKSENLARREKLEKETKIKLR
jgi:hypothetical protein